MKPRRLALWLLLVLPLPASAAEVVREFVGHYEIHPDARMTVMERIRVVAEGQVIRRGIYRDFPAVHIEADQRRVDTGFRVLGATRDGRPEPFHVERQGQVHRVYLGSADALVPSGEHIYELTYETRRQLDFYEAYDEFYWNVTGNGWTLPIESARATLTLPPGTVLQSAEGHTGPYGAKGGKLEARIDQNNRNVATFATTRRLDAGEGLTIVVTWPKGVVAAPPAPSRWGNPVALALLAAAPLLLLWGWHRVGRDPARGTIIPLYAPPEGFSPAAVRHLVRMGTDGTGFTANLIDAAVRGALVIRQSGQVFTLTRTGDRPALTDDEEAMVGKLFEGGRTDLRLQSAAHLELTAAREAMERVLARQLTPLYRHNTPWVIGGLVLTATGTFLADADGGLRNLLPALLLLALMVILGLMLRFTQRAWQEHHIARAAGGALGVVGLGVAGFAVARVISAQAAPLVAALVALDVGALVLFYELLKAPSVEGQARLDEIEGFRRYLNVAEQDRLALENPPERTPELFDRFLPYALALEVEQAWAEQFDSVLRGVTAAGGAGQTYQPRWCPGTTFRPGQLGLLSHELQRSLGKAVRSASSSPTSSSGHSARGGGGFSGGGRGGGGGGGW